MSLILNMTISSLPVNQPACKMPVGSEGFQTIDGFFKGEFKFFLHPEGALFLFEQNQ